MQINEDEEAVIRVRTKFHVSLVFSRMTLEVFEKNGVIYTRQEVNDGDVDDDKSVDEPEYGSDLETQPLDWEDQFTTPAPITTVTSDPPDVIKYAGGDFNMVNDRHATRLELLDIGKSVRESIAHVDDYDHLIPGGTQLDVDMSMLDRYLDNLLVDK